MSRPALITGAGTGIGRAVARRLAAAGHPVALAGRRAAPLEEVASDIDGESLVLAGFDVTDAASVAAGVTQVRDRFGGIAVLINCAGEAPSAPFDKTSREVWDQALGVNLTGTFLVTQAALTSIKSAGNGRIINIASTAGLIGYPYVSAYCAAKHGVVGLTRALALELAGTDVTVNAVCPGFTDTPLVDGAIQTIMDKTGRSADDARKALARSNPQGRLVTPDEVADTVAWLAGEGASAITGQAIAVAGGEVLAG